MSIMDKHSPNMLVSLLRGCRLALHILYGMLLSIIYPLLNHARQRRTVKTWSRQLLTILNIGIKIEGEQLAHGEAGCLMVANHISWLDIFVLNAIHPAIFIAKSEVRDWPFIGWLCKRNGTIFINRTVRQDAVAINQKVSGLLRHGVCIVLFPEGTSSDGKLVGHFHSALIQPSIDAEARLCPIALRYRDAAGELSGAAAFTGDTTLVQSIWNILRCHHLDTLVVFTPALLAANKNRRELARAAQQAIAQELKNIVPQERGPEPNAAPHQEILSTQSTYALLVSQVMRHMPNQTPSGITK